MTHADWVTMRRPPAAERLLARVHSVLAAHPDWEADAPTEALARAGEVLLREVVTEGEGHARTRALDLLAADACITWAFEAAAESPERLVGHARDAMRRLGALTA